MGGGGHTNSRGEDGDPDRRLLADTSNISLLFAVLDLSRHFADFLNFKLRRLMSHLGTTSCFICDACREDCLQKDFFNFIKKATEVLYVELHVDKNQSRVTVIGLSSANDLTGY